jgi:hypothetical protein
MRMLLHKEIRIGGVEVSSINSLLRKMLNGVGRIVPKIDGSRIATVHGDCHANNVMLPEKGKDAVFIDIDGLQRGDYLQDYAEFYCHLCLSLDLEIVAGQNIQLQVGESGKTALLDCDYADPRFWDIQRNILFVASKSQQASKAAILLSRGLGFLENVFRWLPKVGKEPVPVPFTSLSAEDMRGIWAEDG